MTDIRWRKSSYSTAQSNCVEVAELPSGRYGIRDSKTLSAPALFVPAPEWSAFIKAVEAIGL
ncbi:hypothetical protein HDA32_005563 [Spinactinospora alkalitolerans]|uniref:DUF397 domain-containing protein n=1 Tax=Spinactinospora alkalitolerans TaxID=687207 RepID=A0A852U6E5_9ACTN|nr:DUF397 domain-containing protein [Spinactinospora alkalitolerans]NYE50443.1 hypothetical protein [Spinactinospora alkalitolerans]